MVPARLLETRTCDPAFTTVDGQQQGIGIRPVGTVTKQLSRAIQRLREQLDVEDRSCPTSKPSMV